MENQSHKSLKLVHIECCICKTDDARPVGVGEDFEYRTSADTFLAMQCRRCGLVYLNPRPDVSEFETIYPENYHSHIFVYGLFALTAAMFIAEWFMFKERTDFFFRLPKPVRIVSYYVIIATFLLYGVYEQPPAFIYFQF